MSATCRDCNAEITWARTSGRGTYIALDLYPDDRDGIVRKRDTRDENGCVWADVLTGESLHHAIANSEKLYVPHRDTCHARRPTNPMPDHVRRAVGAVRPSHRRRRW